MKIVLGFGECEKREREKIKLELSQSQDKEKIQKKYKELADKYDKLSREEAPERYTYFYLYPDKIEFLHINRIMLTKIITKTVKDLRYYAFAMLAPPLKERSPEKMITLWDGRIMSWESLKERIKQQIDNFQFWDGDI